MIKKIIGALFFIVVILLFCYFRLKPLYYQSVGYTYDQGRDFLKAAQIVIEKRPTFIGPTTGIGGVFHGAWWYYVLVIPFVLFGGLPIGFYYFNFFIHFVSFLILAYFFNRFFGFLTTLLLLLLVATSPYFIFTSIFVGNNIMVLPVLLLFLIANLYLLEEKKLKRESLLIFFVGLLLGFIWEFEFAFGLFLLPTYLLLVLMHRELRLHFSSLNKIKYGLVGLIIPFIPRLLFELKNNFLQTKAIFAAFTQNSMQNPNSYAGAIKDRVILIFDYYRSLFNSDLILLFFTLALFFVFYLLLEHKQIVFKKALSFFLLFFVGLFLISLVYKDNFFWGNYFEGIQYLYILLIALIFSVQTRAHSTWFKFIKLGLFSFLLITTLLGISKDFNKKPNIQGGLQSQQTIVDHIISQVGNKNSYCVKIYTPPAIPYTYDYLFLYNKLSKGIAVPEKDWVGKRCWAIIEPDDFKQRQEKWIQDNIPRVAHVVKQKIINNTIVALYEKE